MVAFSKYKSFWATSAGVIFGGAAGYYGLTISNFRQPPRKWDFNWDKKESENSHKAVRHIILVNNGLYEKAETDEGRILTELGRKQALATGERLKELNYPYTRIVRSTSTSGRETASIIQTVLPNVPVFDCSLIEEAIPAIPDPEFTHWKPGYLDVLKDGRRIDEAFEKYVHRAPVDQEIISYDIIVCHPNVIRYFVCRALQLSPDAWARFSINNASITWLAVRPNGKVFLRQLSESGHMPLNYLTPERKQCEYDIA